MPAKLNLIGQKFGRLTVISQAKNKGRRTAWLCLCSCGNTCIVTTLNLSNGDTQSCGCLKREVTSKARRKHGKTKTPLYNVWVTMRARCSCPSSADFHLYGARGIRVCDEWLNDFTAFHAWAITSGYRHGLTLDRVNVNGNYSPNNCAWVTQKQQAKNKRSSIYYKGIHLLDWCERLEISSQVVRNRLHRGWPLERALFTPLLRHRKTNI